MKKILAVVAVLLLLCTSAFAEDYTVQMDALTMGDGFTFVAPLNWSYRQLTEEETLLNNLFLVGYGREEDLLFVCTIENTGMSLEERKAAMDEDGSFASTEIVTNAQGLPVLKFVYKDNMLAGYDFEIKDGRIISFTWSCISDGNPVTENPYMESIFAQGIDGFAFAEVEAEEGAEGTEGAETTEAAEGAEATEGAESTEGAEPAGDTDPAETTESTETTEPAE